MIKDEYMHYNKMRALITCNQKIEMVKIIMMITLTDVCNSLIFPVSAYVISLLMFFHGFTPHLYFQKLLSLFYEIQIYL